MPEELKTAVQNTGEPTEQEPSATAEPTAPQTGPGLSLTQKYIVDKQGNTVLGDELIKGYNRGRMYDRLQSDYHKTQAELKKIADEYKATAEELNRVKQENMIKEQLNRIVPQKSQSQEDDDSWLTGEDRQIDQEDIVRQLDSVVNQRLQPVLSKLGVDKVETDVETLIEQRLQKREAELEQQRKRQQTIENIRADDLKNLASRYGSVLDEQRIKDILDTLDLSVAYQRRAEEKSLDPDYAEESISDYGMSRDLLLETVEKIATAKIEADKKARDDELKQQLTSGQFPGIEPQGKEERKPIYNERERQKRIRENIERAAKQADAQVAAKRALGGR